MDADFAIRLMTDTLIAATKMAAPILLTTLAVGLLISIVQVVTQVQEMTLTFVPSRSSSVAIMAKVSVAVTEA